MPRIVRGLPNRRCVGGPVDQSRDRNWSTWEDFASPKNRERKAVSGPVPMMTGECSPSQDFVWAVAKRSNESRATNYRGLGLGGYLLCRSPLSCAWRATQITGRVSPRRSPLAGLRGARRRFRITALHGKSSPGSGAAARGGRTSRLDAGAYKGRNAVERFFDLAKHKRGIAAHMDKFAITRRRVTSCAILTGICRWVASRS